MIKIKDNTSDLICANNMKPLEIAVIIDNSSSHNGHIVMRTASTCQFEIIDLTDPRSDNCWSVSTGMTVKLIPKGEIIILELYND